jgi:hypothetical protein
MLRTVRGEDGSIKGWIDGLNLWENRSELGIKRRHTPRHSESPLQLAGLSCPSSALTANQKSRN